MDGGPTGEEAAMKRNYNRYERTIECPCCGGIAATANGVDLWFRDGDALECGCAGHVSVCAEDGVSVYIDEDQQCPCCAGVCEPQP